MFWKFDLHTSSHLDTLLEREDLSLPELLDEEDVLQECKVVNRKLLDFLLQPPHLQAMVAWVTQEPPASGEERLRYKYPSVACEILTSDVPQINDALGADESLLNRLYGFLQSSGCLNPLLASFFSKVMGILINRKTDQLVSFLRKKDDFVDLLLQHIGTSAIMDLLLRLLTCVERPQLRQEVVNWLNEEKIVQRLIEQIHPSKDDNQHSNASQSLCDIIRLSREQVIQVQDSSEPDQLLATLEKQETIEQLLSNMLEGQLNPSVLVSGVQVLLTLLEPRRPRSESVIVNNFFSSVDGQLELLGQATLDSSVSSMGALHALRPRLTHFHQLLFEPLELEPLHTTWGILAPPLGNTRLHVVKLLASALSANDAALTQELLALDVPNTMLDLFFHYVFNNFLHTQVEVCVSTMLSAGPPADSSLETPAPNLGVKHVRSGEKWVTRGEMSAEQQEQWEAFVSGPLAETNKKNMVDLVNTHHLHSSSDDEDDRLKEFNFPEEAVLQQLLQQCRLVERILTSWEENERVQSAGGPRKGYMGHLTRMANALAFMDFQMQRMTSAFIDHFGFNDEEFGEQEESVNAPFDKTANITFSLNADDENPNTNLLEICYKDRIQQFDDDEEEEGQGSGESDGEDGAWQGSQLARGACLGQPPGVRSGGSTDSEDEEEEDEEEDGEEDGQRAQDGAGPPSYPSPGPQPPSPSWAAAFDPVPTDTPTGPQDSGEKEPRSGPPAPAAPLSSPAPCQALVSVRDLQAALRRTNSTPCPLDSATRDPATSVPALGAPHPPQTMEREKSPEPMGLPQNQSAQALQLPPVPNGSAQGGPASPGSQ
ncbi:Serine/threonine-protein phosphatase 6 regulatory subunit 1 [Myotis brandtii]|uniref:Serine/threonine-protein phosphatase 6 regulatory subunit 1 n=1 Tax=Myotis brandtii TaxID=109478 RepID=S7P767_MYOBR|nr:Serine/threonine-protein phosphatase 6 regulatory subunit 1 [Myotis brandtii]